MLNSLVAISVGAACGAVLRWFLGLWFNAAFPQIPLGTLAANLVGGYLIGVALLFLPVIPSYHPNGGY